MEYISTRNGNLKVSFSTAICEGIAPDGGLFVPVEFPKVTEEELKKFTEQSYEERAVEIIAKYATDFTKDEIASCVKKAYSRFDGEVAPIVKIDESLYVLELFHGPTLAFKDVALTLLPQMLPLAKKKVGIAEDFLVLTATSGDTGKAALSGFSDVDGIKIVVFYPAGGVSYVQKRQMVTSCGDNVYVAGVHGNFDDCQNAVKSIFCDGEYKEALKDKGYLLTSANSINFGRLLPQIVYYFSAYADLVQSDEIEFGDKVNFAVPTGNFGDILAGYYAKKMGLPVGTFICASNSNNVLTDFFHEGKYDKNRKFYKTMSPSMDILISSNLERLVFEVAGRDGELTKTRMEELKTSGKYEITERERAVLEEAFYADFASEQDTEETIGGFFDEFSYPLDPHTAVGVFVADKFAVDKGNFEKTVILSTASPYKFCESVLTAIGERVPEDPFKAAKRLSNATGIEIPKPFSELENLEERFDKEYDISDIKNAISDLIG